MLRSWNLLSIATVFTYTKRPTHQEWPIKTLRKKCKYGERGWRSSSSHPRCAGHHSQLISSLPTQNAHAGRKPSLFRRSILIYLNQEWAMKKNYDNKNSLKYINMKWKPTLSFYTTNLSKLDQWDKPGSHWRHVYEWMWTGIYHTKVRPTDLRKMRALPSVAIANYSQRQRHDGALTDVFSIFFKSKWKTTSKDRCPARVKTLQEQISRPIDADTHCFRHASLLKSSFNSNRFYLYKTANSSGMTNKNTTEEMQIWRERLKIVFFSPKMCRTPQSIDFFVTDAKCARRQKTFSFPPEHTDISKPGMSNEKKLWQ